MVSTGHRAGSASGGDALPDRARRPGAPRWRGSREESTVWEEVSAVPASPELRHVFLCLSSGETGLDRVKTGRGWLWVFAQFLPQDALLHWEEATGGDVPQNCELVGPFAGAGGVVPEVADRDGLRFASRRRWRSLICFAGGRGRWWGARHEPEALLSDCRRAWLRHEKICLSSGTTCLSFATRMSWTSPEMRSTARTSAR